MAYRLAGAAVGPPGAGCAAAEQAVEPAGPITYEVAQQVALGDCQRRFYDEVDVVEHDRDGVERPVAVGGGFLELIEQLLGLRQIDGDGRALELFARSPLQTGNCVLVTIAGACVFDADGSGRVARSAVAHIGDGTPGITGQPLAVEGGRQEPGGHRDLLNRQISGLVTIASEPPTLVGGAWFLPPLTREAR